MFFLGNQFYGNDLQTWLFALGLFAATIVVLQVIKQIINSRLAALIKKSSTEIDDVFLPLIRETKLLFFIVVGVYIGSTVLSLPQSDRVLLNRILYLGLFLQSGFWGMGLINYYVSRGVSGKLDEDDGEVATAIDIFGVIAKIVLWILVSLLILDNFQVEVNSLIASLGIGGIAVALAVQNVLGDLFASLSIAMDKPFVIGDFIIVDDEYTGTVEDIGLKSTRVRSLSGEELVFANADLLNSRIRNYKGLQERRNVITFGISYDTPHEKLQQVPDIIKNAITSLDKVRLDRCHLKEMGDFALIYEAVYYVEDPEYSYFMDVQENINLELNKRFQEEDIALPYPTHRVVLEK